MSARSPYPNQIAFRDARLPGCEHIFRAGHSDFAKLVERHRAGFHWLDDSTGELLRHPLGQSQSAPRDFLGDYV